jgi:ankyrin repeat protein
MNAMLATDSTVSGQKRNRPLELEKPIESPAEFIRHIFEENGLTVESSRDQDYFLQTTPEMVDAYDKPLLQAIRERDLERLKSMHREGKTLQACNRFGESVIHMACRNGLTDIVKFLVKEANVSLFVRDDYGRTPIHDACWTVNPNMELMDFLITEAPEMFGLSDVRGHTPFSYARKNHWEIWIPFLMERKAELLVRKESNLLPKTTPIQTEQVTMMANTLPKTTQIQTEQVETMEQQVKAQPILTITAPQAMNVERNAWRCDYTSERI